MTCFEWLKKQKYFVKFENYMQFKLRCPLTTFSWNTVMLRRSWSTTACVPQKPSSSNGGCAWPSPTATDPDRCSVCHTLCVVLQHVAILFLFFKLPVHTNHIRTRKRESWTINIVLLRHNGAWIILSNKMVKHCIFMQ